MNELLAKGATWQLTYRSPGVGVVRAELERLEAGGLARREADGWVLTKRGERQYERLEERFTNSGGHGDYGF